MVVGPVLECKGVNYIHRDPKAASVHGGGVWLLETTEKAGSQRPGTIIGRRRMQRM